jgi:hypothetical protein
MGRQAEMLLAVELKNGWRIDENGESYRWECSLPPRESSDGRAWRLAGKRFGAPTLIPPDARYTDDQVLCGALATFMALEEHECLEWFRVNGKPLVDPHDEWSVRAGTWDFQVRRTEIYEQLRKGR